MNVNRNQVIDLHQFIVKQKYVKTYVQINISYSDSLKSTEKHLVKLE